MDDAIYRAKQLSNKQQSAEEKWMGFAKFVV
jgi:hypothetical protein